MPLTRHSLVAIALAQLIVSSHTQALENETWRKPSRATAVAAAVTCRPPTQVETERAEVALRVLQSFEKHDEIFQAAMSRFGYYDGKAACPSEELKKRIADATLKAGAWDYGLAGPARLALAHQLSGRHPKMIEDVARVAFYGGPIEDEASSDIRPEARSVLASFGRSAAPWREQAIKLMHPRDALGTSAAQVAAASQDPEAVRAVAHMLRQELDRKGRPAVTRDRAPQLVELAYALGAAGETARPYVGILVELLERDVESAAPPFGIIERPPNEVCRALRQISGVEAEKALQSERCREPWFLLPS